MPEDKRNPGTPKAGKQAKASHSPGNPGPEHVSDLVAPLPELNDMAGHDHDTQRLMGKLHGGS